MKKTILVAVCVLLYNANIFAQQNQSPDPMAKAFFPPELVMQNQQVINLTDAQRNSLSKEMQDAQGEFVGLQWDLSKETEKLKLLVAKEKPLEQEVVDQLDKILGIENRIKKRQIVLLIRIKNLLSHEQQEKLQKLKGNG